MAYGLGDIRLDDPVIGFYGLAVLAIASWMVHAIAAPHWRRWRTRRFMRREGLAPAPVPPLGARGPAVERARPAAPGLRRLRARDARLDGTEMTSSLYDDLRSHLVRDVYRRRN
jgi:hypothetical protein